MMKIAKDYYRSNSDYNKGFTLIELLIVITIIALFVVFGAPAFNRYNHKQQVDTKAKEIKSLIDGAYVQSQSIQQGYDSVLVATDDEKVVSYLGDTNQCDISEVPKSEGQIEGTSFLEFDVSLAGINVNDDALLICFSSSGLKQSFSYKSDVTAPVTLRSLVSGDEIKIKVSSNGYEGYGFLTTPNLYIKNVTNSPDEGYKNLITEILYE